MGRPSSDQCFDASCPKTTSLLGIGESHAAKAACDACSRFQHLAVTLQETLLLSSGRTLSCKIAAKSLCSVGHIPPFLGLAEASLPQQSVAF